MPWANNVPKLWRAHNYYYVIALNTCSNYSAMLCYNTLASCEVTLRQLAKLLDESMRTRVFFGCRVQNNPYCEALQNGFAKHRHNLLDLRGVRGVDALQCAVIRLFLVRAIRAWCFFSLLYYLHLTYNTCY